jgi:methionyl-tRNA formyltransferase
MGTINVHGSLLPYYRGAAPINWAIINGEKETGITTFRLKHEIDTGNIILQQRVSIYDAETAGELHDKMKEAGASLLLKTIEGLAEGELTEHPQSLFSKDQSTILKHAPKIFTEACHVNWSKPIDEVYNLIRGLSPYPAAFTEFSGKKLKIYKTLKEYDSKVMPAGSYETDNKSFLKFACNDGYIHLLELQLEGKKRMPVADFLRGFHF